MNEQANAVLITLLEKAVAGVDSAIEFSQAQIPDVIEQLLMWHSIKSLMFFILGLVLVFGSAYIIYYVMTMQPEPDESQRGGHKETMWHTSYGSKSGAEIALVLLVLPIVLGLAFLTKLMVLVQIIIAPKIFLLEYAATLAK